MNPTSLSEKYNNILKLYNKNMMNEICLVKVKEILQIKLCEVQQCYVIFLSWNMQHLGSQASRELRHKRQSYVVPSVFFYQSYVEKK